MDANDVIGGVGRGPALRLTEESRYWLGSTRTPELKEILDQASRQSAVEARALADRIHRELAGRAHTDSVDLLAEDRAR